jgi:polysaccharide export outer membrane protein
MNFKNRNFLFFVGILLLTGSCISNKKIIYLQDLGNESEAVVSSGPRVGYNFEEYLLQAFDIVEINIKTTSPELNELLSAVNNDSNGAGAAGAMMGGGQGGDVFFMNGYTLDENGKVELPLIGEVELVGKSTAEAKAMIENKVRAYVNEDEFFVRVRLGGIRFSALGEFNSSGKLTVLQNRVTIFEAIAAAGDLTILAKRNNLVVLRQYPDGSQIHRINLNDKNLLSSEFYFIRPNDVLYAEPLKVREVGTATNFIQSLTIVTTMITAVALIVTFVNN